MLRVRTTFSGVQGAPWLSTMFFSPATETTSDAQACANAVAAFWNSVKANISNTVTYTVQPQVDVLNGSGHPTGSRSVTGATNNGLSNVAILPLAVQGLVRWRTGVYTAAVPGVSPAREIRGRTFIPGLTTGATTTAGVLTSTCQTTINNAATTLIGTTGIVFAVWSRKHLVLPAIITGSVWDQLAVHRSRRD